MPVDSGGQKFSAWVDDSVSALDFALPRGIGSEAVGGPSQILAHLGVGSHTIGSALGTEVGVLLLGAYDESPSAVGQGNAQALRTDAEGALYTRPASGIMSFDTTSANIHVSGSCLLHSVFVAFNDCNAGNNVVIKDSTGDRFRFVTNNASGHFFEHFTTGVHFGTDLRHARTIGAAGATSVTLVYSRY